ncbi:MAG: NYN domain-containing protein [bacterium]|nr:NYN domain-containing protein [bacterium]
MDIVLLIDGENFKKKIQAIFRENGKERPVWHEYDFRGLFDKVLTGFNIDRKIFYFAKIKEDPHTKEKSHQLIEEQRLLKTHLTNQGFEVSLSGRVRGQLEDGFLGKKILIFREKGVDVKIAVDMVSWSCDKKVREIILASSDSDLQPAIQEIKDRGVSCVYLGLESQPNKGIMFTSDRSILIRNSELFEFEKKS